MAEGVAELPKIDIDKDQARTEGMPKAPDRPAAFGRRIKTGLESGKGHHEMLQIIPESKDKEDNGKRDKVMARATEAPRTRGGREAAFDFDDYLLKNPPIEGVFDPDASEKRAGHEVLQARQEEALMRCRILIEDHIEHDEITPDSSDSRAELKGLVDKFGRHYGFTDLQKDITKDLVGAYYDHRQDGIDLRAQYLDDRKLAEKVTGFTIPEGTDVEVTVGPWGLIISTNNKVTNRVLYRGQTPPTDFIAGGLANIYAVPPFIITNDKYSNEQTLSHEEQHMRYEILRKVFARRNQDIYGMTEENRGYPPSQDQLESQLRNDRRDALDRTKDEIFAYTFNSDHFPIELFTARDNNPYDYLYAQREYGARHGDRQYQEASHNIFVTEYNNILASAAGSFEALLKAGGYDNKEAIGLLSDKPMEQWNATVQRILGAKGVQEPEETIKTYIQYVDSDEARSRPLPITDAVIAPADWYNERNNYKTKGNEDTQKKSPAAFESLVIDQYMSLIMINRLLYEGTRFESDLPKRMLEGEALQQYFIFIDKETVTISGLLQDKQKITEDILKEAKARIMLQVDTFLKRQN